MRVAMRPVAGHHRQERRPHRPQQPPTPGCCAPRSAAGHACVRCAAPRHAHHPPRKDSMRLGAAHALRATTRHVVCAVSDGAAARHAARGSGRLSGCLMAGRLVRSRWPPSATRWRTLFPPKRKAVHAGTLSSGGPGEGRRRAPLCAHPMATGMQGWASLHACGDGPHRRAPPPGASATQASASNPQAGAALRARRRGTRVCGALLPGMRIILPERTRCAWSLCTRGALPPGT